MGCDGARKWINVETHEHFEILVGRVGDEHYWSRGWFHPSCWLRFATGAIPRDRPYMGELMYDIEMSRGYVHGLPDRVGLIKRGGKFFLPDSTGYGGAYERVPGIGFPWFPVGRVFLRFEGEDCRRGVERDPALLEQSLQSIDLSPAGEPTWEVTTWEGTAEEHHAQDLWVVAQHRRWIEDPRGLLEKMIRQDPEVIWKRKRPAPK